MPILSDNGIYSAIESGDIAITPLTPQAVQPCSIDLHLHPDIRRFHADDTPLDLNDLVPHTYLEKHSMNDSILLGPGETVLMSTIERVTLSDKVAGQVDGKSSLGRLFQAVHITAGWIDAGFDGQITLEVINMLSRPVVYYPGMPIAQIVFLELSTPATNPYGNRGHYQSQEGPVESRYKAFRGLY